MKVTANTRNCESANVKSIMGLLEGKVSKLQLENNSSRINSVSPGKSNSDYTGQVLTYMTKLQNMVPFCPKDRPVSKLHLIQSVIDYIYDLQEVLEDDTRTDNQNSKQNITVDSEEGSDSGIDERSYLSSNSSAKLVDNANYIYGDVNDNTDITSLSS